MKKVRLAILISGRGSNMEALLNACDHETYPAKPVLVAANRPGAAGLQTAINWGIHTTAIDHNLFGDDRQAFEGALNAVLEAHQVELVALAGFMRILTPWFVSEWEGRLVNIHPSLLPKYPGLNTHQRALDAGDKEHGCSVHWVTESVDAGAVIAQARIPVLAEDTIETLRARVLIEEHNLYPAALRLVCEQRQLA